jgi:high-affinity K+ transport system ATPase subunit B
LLIVIKLATFKSQLYQLIRLIEISLIGILVQMIHSLFISNNYEVYGPGGLIMPIMVLLIGVGLVWLSDKGIKKGWIE